jgi:BMFP domain-containing protein YqiC
MRIATMPKLATPLSRRHFLRGTGAALLSLPLLDAMTPTFGRAADASVVASPKRFVAACATLGFHTPFLFPSKAGREYELPPYLKLLQNHRDDFTVISGLSHPEQQGNNGHASEMTWLTAAQRPGLAGFRNTVSLDQLIAAQIGIETRFPFLALSTSGRSMSWTASGVEIPGETSPEKLFKALFIEGTVQEVAAEMRQLQRGRSILDTVLGEANKLQRELGPRDRNKLDEYLTAVRNLESRLQQSQGWSTRPKPKTDATPPKDITDNNDAIGKQRLMYDMIVLGLQTDSTRTVTFQLSGMNAVPSNIAGVSNDWHNIPVLVAGGGFKHGSHVAHDEKQNTPLANVFVSLAQRMGLEIDRFGSSTAAGIRGLEAA